MPRSVILIISVLCLVVVPVMAQDDPPVTEESSHTLTVWLPALLLSDTNDEAYNQLLAHTAQFSVDNDVTVDYRTKAIGVTGGIMSTIRSGSVVAPGALPDITLIRRADLISAQASSYLQSLETLFSSALINDLDQTLILGQVINSDGIELFGLPYFIDLQISVYSQDEDELSSNPQFDDVLAHADSFILPVGRTNGLNSTFYLQYLSAGGVPPRNGEMTINQNALQTVLEFYENAVDLNLISVDVLDYNSPSAYRTEFINDMGNFNIGIFSSSEYLSMLQQDSSLLPAAIPTENGDTITSLNGWVWVIVTPDPAQQDLAVRYLNWMMLPEFHAEFASELHQLPAQQSAIVLNLPNHIEPLFIDDLLLNAVPPLADNEGGAIPRAMQEALTRVLNREASAEEATLDVIEQFQSN